MPVTALISGWERNYYIFSMCRYAQSCAFISVIELPRIPAYRPKSKFKSSHQKKKQHKRANSFCYFSNNLFYIYIFYLLVKSRIILFLLLSMLTRKSSIFCFRIFYMYVLLHNILFCIIKIITA